jgi:hypothetical protein
MELNDRTSAYVAELAIEDSIALNHGPPQELNSTLIGGAVTNSYWIQFLAGQTDRQMQPELSMAVLRVPEAFYQSARRRIA